MAVSPAFTWIPFFERFADKLAGWRDRQSELIAFLEDLRGQGHPVTPLTDKDETGRQFQLTEIDPFTFLGAFNRGIHVSSRRQMLAAAKAFFQIDAEVPEDFAGVPTLNNQRSWFIGYRMHRGPDDVHALWEVFLDAIGPAPFTTPAFATSFNRALQVWGTSLNLTIGLFWIRPTTFLSLDSRLRAHLAIAVPTKGIDAAWYTEVVKRVQGEHPENFAQLSHRAWLDTMDKPAPPTGTPAPAPVVEQPPTAADAEYWLVGASWGNVDQTERFLQEGVWENGYDDRYLDVVNSIRPGDRIAIKSAYVQSKNLPFDARGHSVSTMSIKAVGTVLANAGDGRRVQVEWQRIEPARQWFFYTSLKTIWRLKRGDDLAERLIRFVFHGEPQDHAFFVTRWWGDGATRAPRLDASIPIPYGLEDLRHEGVFLSDEEVGKALRRLHARKNLVLQGAPGTGKTFVAKKLAWMLMEEKDPTRLELVQFHPSTSYEDFVRGYRPTESAGQFLLKDGPFLDLCERARRDDRKHVLVIDEINRGNLAQIFGELLMLIEADKRGREHAVTPLYRRTSDEKLDVPDNLYVIGTMNLADRSLALVDFALRRRFAFMTLAPRFADPAYAAFMRERGMKESVLQTVITRMGALNAQIAEERHLGDALRIGHSFFCPNQPDLSELNRAWFDEIVETEIIPLLEEYWHDDRDKARKAASALLA